MSAPPELLEAQRDLTALVIASRMDATIADRHLWVIEAALEVARAERYVALIDAATVFRATVRGVGRVKATGGAPGKARVTLDTGGESEDIETDWLTPGSVALTIAKRARSWEGRLVEVWKHHDPDRTGKVSHGFRQIVWIALADDEGGS